MTAPAETAPATSRTGPPSRPGPTAYLWPGSDRLDLDGGELRLLAVARLLLQAAGVAVTAGRSPAVDATLRADAESWLDQHDGFLRRLRAATGADGAPAPEPGGGPGLVLCPDLAVLSREIPAELPAIPGRVLWADDVRHLVRQPDRPPAALTLTAAEAIALCAAGLDAVSLLGWPDPATSTDPEPRRTGPSRIVIAVDGLHARLLDLVADRVRAACLGAGAPAPILEVLADQRIPGERVLAPVHPVSRSRSLAAADLVLVLGSAPGLDLAAAEAVAAGVPAARLQLFPPAAGPQLGRIALGNPVRPGSGLLGRLAAAGALPGQLRLTGMDGAAGAEPGTQPGEPPITGPDRLRRLAAWAYRVAGAGDPPAG